MNENKLEDILNIIKYVKNKYHLSWSSTPYVGNIQSVDRLNFNNGKVKKEYNISLNVFVKDDFFNYTYLDERGGIETICKTNDYYEILYQIIKRMLDEEVRKWQKSPYIENNDGTRKILFDVINNNKIVYKRKMIELLNEIDPEFGQRYERENI